MKTFLITATTLLMLSNPAIAQVGNSQEMLERVYLDAQVIRRVAEVAHRDLPRDLLMRIIEQDIDLLRGKRTDGAYDHAHFEPIESGRVSEGFTVKPAEEDGRLDRNQFRAKNVFKLIIDIPSRRMLIARNRDIYLDRIEVNYEDQDGNPETAIFEVGQHLDAGEQREYDLPEVASDAIATVYARSESKTANMQMIFVKAELVDNADSPYFGVIQSAKLLQEAIERRDQTAMQSLASSMAGRIDASIGRPTIARALPRDEPGLPPIEVQTPEGRRPEPQPLPVLEIYLQLERIEDLLSGTGTDREDGMERLDELLRELRQYALDAAKSR